MSDYSTIDEAKAAVDAAQAEVDRLTAIGGTELRDAERALRHAKRRLMFARAGSLSPSEHLEDTGAPPGSHEKK